MVEAKAPTSRQHLGSNSLDVHVSAAVCQMKMGQLYLCSVFGKTGLQNYTITQQLAKKFVEHAKMRKKKACTIVSKRTQWELTVKQRQKTLFWKSKKAVCVKVITSLIDTTDITEIPLPISVPEQKKVLNILWCQLMLKEPLL